MSLKFVVSITCLNLKQNEIQIKRWKNFNRHVAAIKKNCESIDLNCRRKQRQAILQWAYNPFI